MKGKQKGLSKSAGENIPEDMIELMLTNGLQGRMDVTTKTVERIAARYADVCGTIKTISGRLKAELVGIRGFSESNIKDMRQFYEEWSPYVNRQPLADDLYVNGEDYPTHNKRPAHRQVLQICN